jgi:hypothetical protein
MNGENAPLLRCESLVKSGTACLSAPDTGPFAGSVPAIAEIPHTGRPLIRAESHAQDVTRIKELEDALVRTAEPVAVAPSAQLSPRASLDGLAHPTETGV